MGKWACKRAGGKANRQASRERAGEPVSKRVDRQGVGGSASGKTGGVEAGGQTSRRRANIWVNNISQCHMYPHSQPHVMAHL
jgi:hypothetical protein